MDDFEILGEEFEIVGDDYYDADDDLEAQGELQGDVEYVGDDDEGGGGGGGDEELLALMEEALIGAKGRRGRGRRFRQGRGRRGRGRRFGTTVVRKKQQTAYSWPVPIDSITNVNPGTSRSITTNPQKLFKPERLVVPSNLASLFTIDDIKVGTRSQFAANGSLPASTFSEQAVAVPLDIETVQAAIDLVTDVTNISGGAVRFRGSWIGRVVTS